MVGAVVVVVGGREVWVGVVVGVIEAVIVVVVVGAVAVMVGGREVGVGVVVGVIAVVVVVVGGG